MKVDLIISLLYIITIIIPNECQRIAVYIYPRLVVGNLTSSDSVGFRLLDIEYLTEDKSREIGLCTAHIKIR